jgi:UDP-N-acetylglucosamine 1-carboxyvinyltransferase
LDLRAGASLILAGIVASGTTYITNENIIKRGYENIVEKLTNIGVDIKEV